MEPMVRRNVVTLALISGVLLLAVSVRPSQGHALLVSRQREIHLLDLSTNEVKLLPAKNLSRVEALAYDPVDRMVYWPDKDLGTISRMRLDGTRQEVVHSQDVDEVYGLEIDVEGRRLYWTDFANARIVSSLLDGTDRRVVINTTYVNPTGIQLDPRNSMLYWTHCAYPSKIERAITDGSHRQTLTNTSLVCGWGFTLDLENEAMYWADWLAGDIVRADMNGSDAEVIQTGLFLPLGPALYGDSLLWTALGRVQRGSVSPHAESDTLASVLASVADFKVTRVADKDVIFAGGLAQIKMFDLHQIPSDLGWTIPLANLSEVVTLDYNRADDRIYWADIDGKTISRAKRDGSGQEIIVSSNVSNMWSLAVSSKASLVFWADQQKSGVVSAIERCNSDGSQRQVIVNTSLSEPNGIAVDDTTSMIYWTDHAKIERASFTGSDRETLVEIGSPSGLTLDVDQGLMYWAVGGKIEVSKLDGTNRRVFTGSRADRLSVHDNTLYWSNNDYIRRLSTTANDKSIRDVMDGSPFTALTLIETDACTSYPCLNGATCHASVNSYSCRCPLGFTGRDCQDQCETDACISNPCANGGTCHAGLNSYSCQCPPDVTGTDCQHPGYAGYELVDASNSLSVQNLKDWPNMNPDPDVYDCANSYGYDCSPNGGTRQGEIFMNVMTVAMASLVTVVFHHTVAY